MKVIEVSPKGEPYVMLPLGVGVTYAEKGGGLCLRDEKDWRKINGFWFNTKWGCVWLTFRRFWGDWKRL
jgi:hypothetical protein